MASLIGCSVSAGYIASDHPTKLYIAVLTANTLNVYSRTPHMQLFQVRDQKPLPTYVKGRAVLI